MQGFFHQLDVIHCVSILVFQYILLKVVGWQKTHEGTKMYQSQSRKCLFRSYVLSFVKKTAVKSNCSPVFLALHAMHWANSVYWLADEYQSETKTARGPVGRTIWFEVDFFQGSCWKFVRHLTRSTRSGYSKLDRTITNKPYIYILCLDILPKKNTNTNKKTRKKRKGIWTLTTLIDVFVGLWMY